MQDKTSEITFLQHKVYTGEQIHTVLYVSFAHL